MTCFAVCHLREIDMGDDIVAYLEGIDETLAPYEGRFVIHGGEKQHLEGSFRGDLIVVAFPDRRSAEGWYASSAYGRILPKRLKRSEGDVFLINGVGPDHRATDVLK